VAATIDGGFKLGKPAVSHGLPAFLRSVATAHEIGAAMAKVEARGIERDPRQVPAALPEEAPHGVSQHPTRAGHREQAPASFLQCGEVRD
jgi:hypothetical protein